MTPIQTEPTDRLQADKANEAGWNTPFVPLKPLMRVLHTEHSFQGPGWYVEARRLKTYSIWHGPFDSEAEAVAHRDQEAAR